MESIQVQQNNQNSSQQNQESEFKKAKVDQIDNLIFYHLIQEDYKTRQFKKWVDFRHNLSHQSGKIGISKVLEKVPLKDITDIKQMIGFDNQKEVFANDYLQYIGFIRLIYQAREYIYKNKDIYFQKIQGSITETHNDDFQKILTLNKLDLGTLFRDIISMEIIIDSHKNRDFMKAVYEQLKLKLDIKLVNENQYKHKEEFINFVKYELRKQNITNQQLVDSINQNMWIYSIPNNQYTKNIGSLLHRIAEYHFQQHGESTSKLKNNLIQLLEQVPQIYLLPFIIFSYDRTNNATFDCILDVGYMFDSIKQVLLHTPVSFQQKISSEIEDQMMQLQFKGIQMNEVNYEGEQIKE